MRFALPLLTIALTACAGTPSATPDAEPPTAAKTATKAPASQPVGGHGEHGDVDAATFVPLDGASVAFAEPADGATVTSPVKVVMTVTGASVQPAGVPKKGTGHHHILINTEPSPAGTTVAKDDTHIHYGDGATEAELILPAGEHTLTLQFADGMHRSYGPDVSQTIKVTVSE